QPRDQVQPLLPLRKCREGGDGEGRYDSAADPGVLRLISDRKSEDPRREEQDSAEDQICQIEIFFTRPHVHDSSFPGADATHYRRRCADSEREKWLPTFPHCKRKSERAVPILPLRRGLGRLA